MKIHCATPFPAWRTVCEGCLAQLFPPQPSPAPGVATPRQAQRLLSPGEEHPNSRAIPTGFHSFSPGASRNEATRCRLETDNPRAAAAYTAPHSNPTRRSDGHRCRNPLPHPILDDNESATRTDLSPRRSVTPGPQARRQAPGTDSIPPIRVLIFGARASSTGRPGIHRSC